VLDPFAGIGTTNLQCQLEGINSIGVEINPFLHYVSDQKTKWTWEPPCLSLEIERYLERVEELRNESSRTPLKDFPKVFGIELPLLSNYQRWWSERVLRDLLLAKDLLAAAPSQEREFLRLGLMSILLDVANVTYEGVQFTFLAKPRDPVDIIALLRSRLLKMCQDVQATQENIIHPGEVEVLLGDSTELESVIGPRRPSCVITSPPYPNRYSYVWNTRPYLYFFEFFSRPVQASQLDAISIGGTWGTATSSLVEGKIKPVDQTLSDIIAPYSDRIRNQKLANTNIMGNYIAKYFNKLYLHARSLSKVVSEECKVAYVVGNSEIKNVEIPTDILLGRILESQGFKVNDIWRIRKRHGGKSLYEAIVLGTKM
jgi:DNA modification methylase